MKSPVKGCTLSQKAYQGNRVDITVAIDGRRKDDALVDVYAPSQNQPLEVWMAGPRKYIDTEKLYIQQSYWWSADMKPGAYYVAAKLDDKTITETFQLSDGHHWIYAHCNE